MATGRPNLRCICARVWTWTCGSSLLAVTAWPGKTPSGSKEHNIALRQIAIDQGYKLNEYGLFDHEDRMVAGATEKDIYEKLGLAWIPPELRENRGELQAAREGRLPRIIGYGDIKGDLHVHCDWNGGANSIEEIAQAALALGYDYVGIADHTKFLRIEHGLDEAATAGPEPGDRGTE